MKFLLTLLVLLSVSFGFAQDNTSNNLKEIKTETTQTVDVSKTLVISVKGIKTMDEIDIENYNKSIYLNLIATKKQKPKTC